MKYVFVENGTVREILPYNPFEWIPNEDFLHNCHEVPDEVGVGWRYSDGMFLPLQPDTSILSTPTVEERLAAAEQALLALMEVE